MRLYANEKGTTLIIAISALLILSLLAVVVVSMVGKESYSTLHQAQSGQAFSLAEAGAHRALSYLSREGGECSDLSDAEEFANVSLGRGTFTVTGTHHNPTPTTLTADIGSTDTTIPVVSTAGYAPHGTITIASEAIHYSGTTATSFTGARRGVSGTTPDSHSASSADVVMDWTLGESVNWAIGSVALKPAGAPPIAFDNGGSVVQNSSQKEFIWSHTVSGSDRILIVGVSMRRTGNQSVQSVTYGGTSGVFVGAEDGESGTRLEIWRLMAPTPGTTNVVVTLSNPAKIVGGAVSLTGVDQTNPIAASGFASGSSANPTLTLAAVDINAWVIDVLAFRATGNANPTATPGEGQVQRVSGYTETGAAVVNIRGKASTKLVGRVYQDQCLVTSTGSVGANASTGITFDKYTTLEQDNCDPCEWQHTVTASGTDRILVVSFGYGDDPNPIVGVTYDGVALTQIRTEIIPGGRIASMWYLLNPPTGDHTVSVNLTAATTQKFSGTSASYAGVDQTNPVEATHVGAQGTSATSTVDITTTNASAWIIDSHNAQGNWTIVPKTGRVTRWNSVDGTITGAGSTMKTTAAGTFTLDWTENSASSGPWVIVAAALKPTDPNPATSTFGPAQRVVEVGVRSP